MLPDPPREKIALPPAPVASTRGGFPLIATLAPVVMSLVLWAVTGSVFSLLFAVLGPVVALGGLVDGGFARRRARRRERERFQDAVAETLASVAAAHERERARRAGIAISPGSARWRDDAGGCVPVALGCGTVGSVVEVTGSDSAEAPAHRGAIDRIRAAAARLVDAPVLVDARDGIALIGPPTLTAAVARGIGLQVAGQLSPRQWRVHAPAGEGWATDLPHAGAAADAGAQLWRAAGSADIVIAQGTDPSQVPASLGVVLEMSADGCAVAVRGDVAAERVRATALGAAEAAECARALAERASGLGLRPSGAGLPDRVDLADLLIPADPRDALPRTGLAAPIGRGARGVVTVDLVADGPHAVVAGTTGSGKSELLVSWVLGMAAGRSPGEVTFLLVDFKGGAAFAPLTGIPHVLGTVSDLDQRSTRRAIESLRAELRRRERVLADAAARSIDELPPQTMPRLVVVVDEFAAMVSARPELHEVFVDLSARGRSLGLHLVLCTQRPAGVIRDAVLANVGLRISLRVADRADSIAVVGDDSAAALPVEPRGRGMLAIDGAVSPVQLAIASAADARRIAAHPSSSAEPVRRPWCEPLPHRLELEALPVSGEEGIPFGLTDMADEQRQPTAVYDPVRHGHLLVLGTTGSGTTTTLDTLAFSAAACGRVVMRIPHSAADAWAELVRARDHPEAGRLLLIDDLDSLLGRFDDDYRHGAGDLLAGLLRGSPADSDVVVASARRLTGMVAGLAGSFGSRVLLRQGSREDHLLAGGDASRFDPDAPPGSGTWRGFDVQMAIGAPGAPPAPPSSPLPIVTPAQHPVLAVVAGRPARLVGALRASGCRVVELGRGDAPAPDELLVTRGAVPTVLVGDPDAWQAEWMLLTEARRRWPIVLAGCTPADHRILLRDRELPPPLGDRPGECWLASGGLTVRAVFDLAATLGSEEKRP